jgi:hypothetical protein
MAKPPQVTGHEGIPAGSNSPPIDANVRPYQTLSGFQASSASRTVVGGSILAELSDLSKPALGDLLATLRKYIDQKDELEAQVKTLNEAVERIEAEVKARMMESKTEKVSGAGLTVTLSEKQGVRYDPHHWDMIVKTFVDAGKIYLIQRRLSDAKIREEFAAGSLQLPKGLTIEPFRDLSVRRVK